MEDKNSTEQPTLDERKFAFEQEKYQLEKDKYERDKQLLNKHLATIITAIVSVTAVLVSIVQIYIAAGTKEKELALLNAQKDREMELSRATKDRDASIDLAKFIVANKDSIYGQDKDRELVKNIILVAYPDFSNRVFKTLEETSPDDASKQTWKQGQEMAEKSKLSKIVLAYYASTLSNADFDATNAFLTSHGFLSVDSKLYSNAPKWMEKQCSIIYYDDNNYDLSISLAAELKGKTGKNFRIIKGRTFPEIRGQESSRLFVHHTPISSEP